MRSGDTSAECGVRNAECIGRWSIRAAGSRDRTRRLNSAFRIPHSALGGAVMGGVWLAIDTATEIASVAAGRPPRADSGAQVQGARRHAAEIVRLVDFVLGDRKSTRLNSSHGYISYAVFCLKKKNKAAS